MARRPKRSPEQILAEKERTWRTMGQGGNCYGGNRLCAGPCGTITWCMGKNYNRQLCHDCFLTY